MNRGERIVIVGGGPGGLAAARAYRESGGQADVLLITAEDFVPYNRPPLTKEFLRGEMRRDELPIENPGWFAENDVEVELRTTADALDRVRGVVLTGGGKEIPYDYCVLATGSEPIRLPVPGGDDPDISVIRTLNDSEDLKKRAVRGSEALVVGSGFIGCEAAASLAMRGVRVTLVSQEETPQETRLGPEVGERILGWLQNHGILLRLGLDVEGIERRAEGFQVATSDGETLRAGLVVFGTGVKPRVELAEEAGLEIADGGISATSEMRTSDERVFAVGDIARAMNETAGSPQKVEHWGDALEHGRVAGTVLAGGDARYVIVPGFWSTIGDQTLKYWSWSGGWDEARFVEHGDGAFTTWYGMEGKTIGVLAHGHDEDYEQGRALIERGDPLPQ